MKRKKPKPKDWSKVAWTPFLPCDIPADGPNTLDPPVAIYRNSRYQVTLYMREYEPPFGVIAHLSFKVHDRSAHHDWRDMQRIKNELIGPEFDAVEIYPAESKLVDSANQYHLFVFRDLKLPFGFQTRLVGDGNWNGSVQRQFEVRPADCLNPEEYDRLLQEALAKAKRKAAGCDCIATGNTNKPKQHGADPHAKNCSVYIGKEGPSWAG